MMVLVVGWLMSSCVHRNPWNELNTRDLGCTSFEIVIARGVEFRVASLAGVVYAIGAPDGNGPVEGVRVVLRRLGAREQLAATMTSSDGRFAFPDTPVGWYQLETCRDGFNSVVAPVLITRHPRGAPLVLRVSVAS